MCLAVPFKIMSITGNDAVADRDGIERRIRIDLTPGVHEGDYVLVHAGFAIEKLAPDDASERLETARELAAEIAGIASEIRNRKKTLKKTQIKEKNAE